MLNDEKKILDLPIKSSKSQLYKSVTDEINKRFEHLMTMTKMNFNVLV